MKFLINGRSFLASQVRSERTNTGSYVWVGNIGKNEIGIKGAANPLNSVILVRRKGKVMGKISIAGQSYLLKPSRVGEYRLIEVNEENAPVGDGDIMANTSVSDNKLQAIKSISLDSLDQSNTEIAIMVNYTHEAYKESDDIDLLIDFMIAEANQSYINSEIKIALVLAGTSEVDSSFNDFGGDNHEAVLNSYVAKNDGKMDEIHQIRDMIKADIGVLLVSEQYTSYGKAASILADESKAFAIVRVDKAVSAFTFSHEIGHLQGARHDLFFDTNGVPFRYGHGYEDYIDGRWRSIMSGAPCQRKVGDPKPPVGPCRRINYWSNPEVIYLRMPMGEASYNDNAHVLNQTRQYISTFR